MAFATQTFSGDATIAWTPASRRALATLAQAMTQPRLREVIHKQLQHTGDHLAQRLRGHEPWRGAKARGPLTARLIPRGPVLADIAWRSHRTLHARQGMAFAIPLTPDAIRAGSPGLHPGRLVRILYARTGTANRTGIYAGLYSAADLARTRNLREIPTHWLLAERFNLAPAVLRARIERRLPQYLGRMERRLARHVDPWS
jgi:hypothetical protein